MLAMSVSDQELARGNQPGIRATTAALLMTVGCKRRRIGPCRHLAGVLRRAHSMLAGELLRLLADVWFLTHPTAAGKRAA
jgi:hypothetical protein